jgi:hypothetical protein
MQAASRARYPLGGVETLALKGRREEGGGRREEEEVGGRR